MLNQQLQKALSKLDLLIEFTKEDIQIVKEAKHSELSQRVEIKETLLREFDDAKHDLNLALMDLGKNKDSVSEYIDDSQKSMLDLFKRKLTILKSLNSDLASIVIVLNEFYNSMMGNMFSFDTKGYQYSKPNPSAMLKVSA